MNELTTSQQAALDALQGDDNLFITGSAGTGKSYLITEWLSRDETWQDQTGDIAIVASTGAAAILVGGVTFHSFFGLGLAQESDSKIRDKVRRNRRTHRRIQETSLIILDEVSMISGRLLGLASQICQDAMDSELPWGGIRIVCIGDFHQLPPISASRGTDWAFLHPAWEATGFHVYPLREVMRTQNEEFMKVLEDIRSGRITQEVNKFMAERIRHDTDDLVGTRLYSRKNKVAEYNLERLVRIPSPTIRSITEYTGDESCFKRLKKSVPFDEKLMIKKGALVMMRKNKPPNYVNGTLGTVKSAGHLNIQVELQTGGVVTVKPERYEWHNADGAPIASATNYPLSLAYAQTIHKAQGASIDSLILDIKQLWECGHAYVALSRATDPDRLWIQGWSPQGVLVDPAVVKFYEEIEHAA